MSRRVHMSPHDWGVCRRRFSRLTGEWRSEVVSRHKTAVAAQARRRPGEYVRRLTVEERK